MLKIQRSSNGEFVLFSLSGRIQEEQLAELQSLLEAEDQSIVLDLREVGLVDRDAVRFLASCEEDGSRLDNCPAYIREWIVRERAGK